MKLDAIPKRARMRRCGWAFCRCRYCRIGARQEAAAFRAKKRSERQRVREAAKESIA